MIRDHPYQNVYFNLLAGSDKRHRFELDYWGLSYKEAWNIYWKMTKEVLLKCKLPIHQEDIPKKS